MRKLLDKIIKYMLIGIGFGSTSYLLTLTFGFQQNLPTLKNTMSILVMSMLIGIVSMIYDVEKIPFLLALVMHFIATLFLVIVTMLFNGWSVTEPVFWLIFIGIYVAIWLIIALTIRINAREMNEQLRKKREFK